MIHNLDLERVLEDAAKHLGCCVSELTWWSWPEAFGSTSGPRGGIQMVTTFQVLGFRGPKDDGVLWCAGVWRRWTHRELRWRR